MILEKLSHALLNYTKQLVFPYLTLLITQDLQASSPSKHTSKGPVTHSETLLLNKSHFVACKLLLPAYPEFHIKDYERLDLPYRDM